MELGGPMGARAVVRSLVLEPGAFSRLWPQVEEVLEDELGAPFSRGW